MATPTPLSPPRTRTTLVSRTAPPVVQAPGMAACVIGPAKEIVEAQLSSGSANPAALVSVAASIIGTDTGATKDVADLSIRVTVDGDATDEVVFPTSPSGGELSARLVVNLLDAGISGVSVTKDSTNQIHFITSARGDSASLKMLRGKVRVTHSAVTSGPFVVGDELQVQGGSVVIGTVSRVVSSTVTIVDLSTGTFIPVNGTIMDVNATATATVSAVWTAYDALGITEFEDLVEGTSTYRNRAHRIALDTLPVVHADSASSLVFDTDTLGMFRSFGGRLYQFGTDFATLRSRSHQATTTLGQARAVYPSGDAHTNTNVTYTSVSSTNGSEIAVAHRRAITITTGAITNGPFVAGRLLRNTTPATDEIVGIILSVDTPNLKMEVALYGVAPADTNALSDGTATANVSGTPAATLVPICRVESRLFRLTFGSSSAYQVGETITNETVGAGTYTVGTVLHVVDAATSYIVVKLSDSGYPVTVGSIVVGGTSSVSNTVTAITDLGADKLVVAYAGSAAVSAAMVAEYINRTADTTALVRAEVGGASPGSGYATVTGAIVPLSPMSTPASGTTAETKFVGYPWDDRDGDTKTPYFWARGSLASASFGTGDSEFTITAKGGQNLAATGNYHGVAGNAITVEGIDCAVSAVTITVTGTAIRVFYKGPVNSSTHTASDIVTAINAHATASAMVVASTSVGDDSPTGWCVTTLVGGQDPLNFLQAPAPAVVWGERTQQNFGYIRVDVASTASFLVGETLRLTSASGAVVGIIREIDSANSVLWVDGTHHTGDVTVGGTAVTPVLDVLFAPAITSYFVGWNMRIVSGGTGSGTREITAYTSARVALVASAWTIDPDTNDTYVIEAPGTITDGASLYGVTSAATTTVTDVVAAGVATGDTLDIRYNGGLLQTVTFTATTVLYEIVSQINNALAMAGEQAAMAVVSTSLSPLMQVKLLASGFDANDRGGIESVLVLGGTAVEKVFGLQPGGRTFAGAHEGLAFKTLVGDELWSGTTRLGRITSVASATVGSQAFPGALVKIDSDTLTTSTTWSNWWVKAKNLTVDDSLDVETVGGVERPTPGLIVDVDGNALLIHQAQARKTDGTYDAAAQQSMYVDYDATRTDLSGELLTFGSVTELEEQLSPVSPENPLAWGVYSALLNSGNYSVQAVAVNETSEAYPDGTITAYEEALTHLNETTYSIVPLTRNRDVLEFLVAENDAAAAPSDDSDVVQVSRLILIGHAQPTEGEPTLVASGTGTLTDTNTIEIDPDTMNVVSELVAAGFEDPESMTWSDFLEEGIYLTTTTTKGRFSISSIDGQIITVVTDADSFEPDDNDDEFYSNAELTTADLDLDPSGETVTLRIRGESFDITTTSGKNSLITAIGTAAQVYASRRVRFVMPDIGMAYNGTTQVVGSQYGACMLAGAFSSNSPKTTYFNFPLVGAVSVSGSSDMFTPTQLNQGAGYGVWWLVQTSAGGSVVCRDQPTTDFSTEYTKEHSIVHSLDWFERLVRQSVTRGPDDNITQAYLQSVALALNACAKLAVQNGILQAELTGVRQNEDDPKQVDADFSVLVLQPARELNITITI